MKILFFISFLFLYMSVLLFKKTDRKLNIIINIIYLICIFYFYNMFIATVLSYLNIKNDLFVFSIIYISSFFIIYLYHKRKNGKIKFQQYYLEKKDIICLIIIIILCFCIGVIRYSPNFRTINYEVGDSAIHYKMSVEYSKYGKLFDEKYHSSSLNDFNHSIFGYYVLCGMFMKLSPFSTIVSYNLFNTIILCLLASCFYITLLSTKEKRQNTAFSLLLVILYTLAYPLNYMLYGYGYFGVGILATNLIILTFRFISKHNRNSLYLPLFLFNFGLFSSYYLFVPIVFLSEFIYLAYLFKIRKINLNILIKVCFLCLLIPSIFGFNYFISSTSITEMIENYGIEGDCYQNLIGNYILLIPLVCYSVYEQAKKNKVDFDLIFLICLILYIVFTFLFIGNGYVSSYYFYKTYYILWIIVNIFVYKLINKKEYKKILFVHFLMIVLIVFFSIYDIEKIVSEKDKWFEYSGIFGRLEDIYVHNIEKINNPEIRIHNGEYDLITSPSIFSKQCNIKNSNAFVPYITSSKFEKYWYYYINDFTPNIKYNEELVKRNIDDTSINNLNYSFFTNYSDIKCILINNDAKKQSKDNDFNNDYDVLFKNKIGKLYRKTS